MSINRYGPAAQDAATEVFLVDDEPDLLDEIGEFLDGCGIPVVAASRPQKILERLQGRTAPFVLLTDLHMPGMSGIELTAELRQASAGPKHFKSILFSGAGDMNLAIAALQNGVMDFLLKPLDLDRLAATTRLAMTMIEEESAAANVGANLRQEVEQLAGVLAKVGSLASAIERAPPPPPAYGGAMAAVARPRSDIREVGDKDLLEAIKREQMLRARRNKLLPVSAGADPAWEIMLFLMEQTLLGRSVSVTSACHACSVPPTTALRKIDDLLDESLLEREPDPKDRRRVLLRLTGLGEDRLRGYLGEAIQAHRRAAM